MGSAGLRWRLPETVIDMDRCTMGYEIVAQIPVPGLRSEVERCPTVGVLMRWYVQEGGWVQGRMYLFFDVHPKRGYVMGHEEAFAALLLAASVVQRRPAWSKKHVVSPVLLGTDIDALHPLCCPLLLASRQPQPRSDFSVPLQPRRLTEGVAFLRVCTHAYERFDGLEVAVPRGPHQRCFLHLERAGAVDLRAEVN